MRMYDGEYCDTPAIWSAAVRLMNPDPHDHLYTYSDANFLKTWVLVRSRAIAIESRAHELRGHLTKLGDVW